MRRASSGPIRPARRSSVPPPRRSIAARKFDAGQPAAAQIAQLAATLPADGPPQSVRLRGFGAGIGRALTCQCSRIVLADGSEAILVAATERAGPDSVARRTRSAIAGGLRSAGRNVFNRRHAPARDAGRGFVCFAARPRSRRWGSRRWRRMPCALGHAAGRTPRCAVRIDRIGCEAGMRCCSRLSPTRAKRR